MSSPFLFGDLASASRPATDGRPRRARLQVIQGLRDSGGVSGAEQRIELGLQLLVPAFGQEVVELLPELSDGTGLLERREVFSWKKLLQAVAGAAMRWTDLAAWMTLATAPTRFRNVWAFSVSFLAALTASSKG